MLLATTASQSATASGPIRTYLVLHFIPMHFNALIGLIVLLLLDCGGHCCCNFPFPFATTLPHSVRLSWFVFWLTLGEAEGSGSEPTETFRFWKVGKGNAPQIET